MPKHQTLLTQDPQLSEFIQQIPVWEIGGGWGDAINWLNPKEFQGEHPVDKEFSIVGWKTPKPQVGDFLLGEFEKSWIYFKIVSIEPCGNLADMFFGKVVMQRQMWKD